MGCTNSKMINNKANWGLCCSEEMKIDAPLFIQTLKGESIDNIKDTLQYLQKKDLLLTIKFEKDDSNEGVFENPVQNSYFEKNQKISLENWRLPLITIYLKRLDILKYMVEELKFPSLGVALSLPLLDSDILHKKKIPMINRLFPIYYTILKR